MWHRLAVCPLAGWDGPPVGWVAVCPKRLRCAPIARDYIECDSIGCDALHK